QCTLCRNFNISDYNSENSTSRIPHLHLDGLDSSSETSSECGSESGNEPDIDSDTNSTAIPYPDLDIMYSHAILPPTRPMSMPRLRSIPLLRPIPPTSILRSRGIPPPIPLPRRSLPLCRPSAPRPRRRRNESPIRRTTPAGRGVNSSQSNSEEKSAPHSASESNSEFTASVNSLPPYPRPRTVGKCSGDSDTGSEQKS
ncbi:hypothetical protein C0J52_19200, partial [Blattella germanica]